MTVAARTEHDAAVTRTRRSRLLRWAGWTLIVAGCVVLLYLVYSLLFTNLETGRAQARLLEAWEREVGTPAATGEAGEAGDGERSGGDGGGERAEALDPAVRAGGGGQDGEDGPDIGSAVAMIEFVRPASTEPVVREEPLMVVEGVAAADLRAGPGQYPDTAPPGGAGNFAVAGHRTTYGAPFFDLDELEPGDEIHVTGRDGARHVYEVVAEEIVGPRDTWVVGRDPLGSGEAVMTLTTCHPRFSAAQRLVVFAELVA